MTPEELEEPLIVEEYQNQNNDEARRKTPLLSMVANFTTSYNAVNISLVLPILEILVSTTTEEDKSLVASSLLGGMIVGQIVGGALGDLIGRLRSLYLVMGLQVVASLGSACIDNSRSTYMVLAAWRFVLGLGAGGVYPLAAVLAAEDGGRGGDRTTQVVQTFAVQGIGFLCVPVLAVPLLHTNIRLGVVWRIILAAGSLPGLILLFVTARQKSRQQTAVLNEAIVDAAPTVSMQNGSPQSLDRVYSPPQHRRLDTEQREALCDPSMLFEDSDGEAISILDSELDMEQRGAGGIEESDGSSTEASILTEFHIGWWGSIRREHHLFRKLMGTAFIWFLFDVLFYGNTLFQPVVLEAAFGGRKAAGGRLMVQEAALDSLYVALIALPGYFVAYLVLGESDNDNNGRYGWAKKYIPNQTPRYVMLQGFACMSVLYLSIGLAWRQLEDAPILLIILYGSTFFFANYGPNTTTFLLPSLVYSEECRSTLNGLSAAAGKVGALTGAMVFAPAADGWGDSNVMIICGATALVALLVTKVFVRVHHHTARTDQG